MGAARAGSVVLVGRGRVGRSLARALRAAGYEARLVAGRREVSLPEAELIVLCTPDGALLEVASRLPRPRGAGAVVHVAGVLDPDHLASARELGWSVGQAHPLVAVATPRTALTGATLLIGGDARAVLLVRRLARRIGMKPLVAPELDRALWHAVAALVANGASALAALGDSLWREAGVPEAATRAALASLLASVAGNVARVGTTAALTGPVRRGDASTVARHLAVLATADTEGEIARLYASLALGQIGLARALGEADLTALARIRAAASNVLAHPRLRRVRHR